MYVLMYCILEKIYLIIFCLNSNKYLVILVVLIRYILNFLSVFFLMKDIVIIMRYLFWKYDVFVICYYFKKNFIGWNGCKII